jgi:hypothetical protein
MIDGEVAASLQRCKISPTPHPNRIISRAETTIAAVTQ